MSTPTPRGGEVKWRLRGVGGHSNAQLFPSLLLPEMRLGVVASETFNPAAEEYLPVRKEELDTLAAEGLFSVRYTVGLPLKMESFLTPSRGATACGTEEGRCLLCASSVNP